MPPSHDSVETNLDVFFKFSKSWYRFVSPSSFVGLPCNRQLSFRLINGDLMAGEVSESAGHHVGFALRWCYVPSVINTKCTRLVVMHTEHFWLGINSFEEAHLRKFSTIVAKVFTHYCPVLKLSSGLGCRQKTPVVCMTHFSQDGI